MDTNGDYFNESEYVDLINEYLDELGIPRKSEAGALYSTYGRVCLLGDRMKAAEEYIETLRHTYNMLFSKQK